MNIGTMKKTTGILLVSVIFIANLNAQFGAFAKASKAQLTNLKCDQVQ